MQLGFCFFFQSEKTHSSMENEADLGQFPNDVIAEILSRLPVKILLKFKSVSKSWKSLISSGYFIKLHLQNSKHRKIISTIKRPFPRLELYSFPSLSFEKDYYSLYFDCTIEKPWGLGVVIGVVGCCNGLVCLIIDKKYFHLWNPATKQSRRLPDFLGAAKNVRESYISMCGFGFDESSDDYKVFVVMPVIKFGAKPNLMYQEPIGKVYSLKADSWKTIQFVEDDSPLDPSAKFASGKLHWIQNSGCDIVTFDLKNEGFGTVELPINAEPGFYPTLCVVNGYLSLLCDYCRTRLDVWIQKQYGVQDSWTLLVSVPDLSEPESPFPLPNPLCVLPNYDVLFIHESNNFVSYNARSGWVWTLELLGPEFLRESSFDSVEFHGAEAYGESLVSVVPDGEIKSAKADPGGRKSGKSRMKGRANNGNKFHCTH